MEIVYLFLGFLSIAGSAAVWSCEHRIHHAKTDTLEDPYSIKRGFWFAHMGWLFAYKNHFDTTKIADLWSSKWIRWQHQYYIAGVVVTNSLIFI